MATLAVWRVAETEAEAAGAVLARAFVDEPVFVAALAGRADRARLCPPLFAANLRHACRFGEAWAVGTRAGEPLGVAYWVPRPEPELTAGVAEELGFAALQGAWGPALARIGGFEAAAARSLGGLPEPWRYLGAIGVAPDRQGQGLGSALLGRILADAAAAGSAVGLVTDRAENVPFYRRAGLDVVAAGVAPDGSVPWWSLGTPRP